MAVGEDVKNRLKVLRAERDWSQAELGGRLGVSRQAVNAIETGKYEPSLPLPFRLRPAPPPRAPPPSGRGESSSFRTGGRPAMALDPATRPASALIALVAAIALL